MLVAVRIPPTRQPPTVPDSDASLDVSPWHRRAFNAALAQHYPALTRRRDQPIHSCPHPRAALLPLAMASVRVGAPGISSALEASAAPRGVNQRPVLLGLSSFGGRIHNLRINVKKNLQCAKMWGG